MHDCTYRRINSSGVASAATPYPSSLGRLYRPPGMVVEFLSREQGRWLLASEVGYEDIAQLGEIRQAIPRTPSSPPAP